MVNPYEALRKRIQVLTGLGCGLPNRICPTPELLGTTVLDQFEARYALIRDFQSQALRLFLASLDGEEDPVIASDFFRDLPPCFGSDFHRSLPRSRLEPPMFFRTDEVRPGRIAEIQCPGSGWGEQSLLHEYFCHTDNDHRSSTNQCESPAAVFNNALLTKFESPPRIQHFFENSSSWLSNFLHICYSRLSACAPTYWGFEPNLRAKDCNLVRTHLFVSLLAENFSSHRLEEYRNGLLHYDLPPICIFEQKLLLALPFEPQTSHHFPEEARTLFPFTTIVRPSGVRMASGDIIPLSTFGTLSRRQRNVFLKYAGIDPSRNWGSRAVYSAGELSKAQMRRLLRKITHEYQTGKGLWIAQACESEQTQREVLRHDGTTTGIEGYSKYSAFYGPSGFISANQMVREKKKVHGQPDSTVNLVCFRGEVSNGATK